MLLKGNIIVGRYHHKQYKHTYFDIICSDPLTYSWCGERVPRKLDLYGIALIKIAIDSGDYALDKIGHFMKLYIKLNA